MQLVGPHVTLYMPSGGRGGTLEPRRSAVRTSRQRFGVPPEKVVEVMALTGDSIDNIPGVKGIGDKTAQALIRAFGSVDELLARLDEVEKLGCAAPSAFASCSRARRSRRARRASSPV